MRYHIEYSDECCNYANDRKELLEWLKLLADYSGRSAHVLNCDQSRPKPRNNHLA